MMSGTQEGAQGLPSFWAQRRRHPSQGASHCEGAKTHGVNRNMVEVHLLLVPLTAPKLAFPLDVPHLILNLSNRKAPRLMGCWRP